MENIYDFVRFSESEKDYVERLSICSSVLMLELSERLDNCYIPLQLVPVIDEMDIQTKEIVESLNSMRCINGFPDLDKEMFLNLIRLTNKQVYEDYMYAKFVLPN